jgi:hypothetical protein
MSIFKDKTTSEEAKACMGSGKGLAVMPPMESGDSYPNAKVPGQHNWRDNAVVNRERPRRGHGY